MQSLWLNALLAEPYRHTGCSIKPCPNSSPSDQKRASYTIAQFLKGVRAVDYLTLETYVELLVPSDYA